MNAPQRASRNALFSSIFAVPKAEDRTPENRGVPGSSPGLAIETRMAARFSGLRCLNSGVCRGSCRNRGVFCPSNGAKSRIAPEVAGPRTQRHRQPRVLMRVLMGANSGPEQQLSRRRPARFEFSQQRVGGCVGGDGDGARGMPPARQLVGVGSVPELLASTRLTRRLQPVRCRARQRPPSVDTSDPPRPNTVLDWDGLRRGFRAPDP
jgi:hypothetical protein